MNYSGECDDFILTGQAGSEVKGIVLKAEGLRKLFPDMAPEEVVEKIMKMVVTSLIYAQWTMKQQGEFDQFIEKYLETID